MSNTFQITGWEETPYIENEDGSKKTHAKIKQDYTGVIEGSSELHYLMSYQSAASALFVGFEVVSGTVSGQPGSFTLQHSGKFENGIASSDFVVVPGSGSGELAKIEGSGSFQSGEAGKASYQLITNIL